MILVEQRYGDLNRGTTPYYEQLNAAVGAVHPVFWPEGYLSDFSQYTRAYERELYETFFVPNNTTIVLVGGVRLEDMVPLVDALFGYMERVPEPSRTPAVEPVPAAERRVVYRSDQIAPRVEVRYLMPGVGHPDRPLFDVLLGVVQRTIDRALEQRNISARVDANTRVVHTTRFGVPSSMNVELVLSNENDIPTAETVLLSTLDELGRTPVDPALVAIVQKHLRTDWHRLTLDAGRLAFEIGHFQTMDSWQTLQPYLEARDTATAGDLMRLARRYFVPENRTIGVVHSGSMDRDPTSGGSR